MSAVRRKDETDAELDAREAEEVRIENLVKARLALTVVLGILPLDDDTAHALRSDAIKATSRLVGHFSPEEEA